MERCKAAPNDPASGGAGHALAPEDEMMPPLGAPCKPLLGPSLAVVAPAVSEYDGLRLLFLPIHSADDSPKFINC